jgi:hypothetical protein
MAKNSEQMVFILPSIDKSDERTPVFRQLPVEIFKKEFELDG